MITTENKSAGQNGSVTPAITQKAGTVTSMDFIELIWSDPLGKVALIVGGLVALGFCVGGSFRLIAWILEGWNRVMAANQRGAIG